MDFLSTSDCLYDRRHSIISPEPIKTAYSALAEARFACDYSLSENNASRYTNPDRHHCEVSIESETYNYSNDLDKEAQKELLMIVTSPMSRQPMDEPIQRTHVVPAAIICANVWSSPLMPDSFMERRCRSQSVNDCHWISVF